MGNIIIPPVGVAGITPVQVLQLSVTASFNCYTGSWGFLGYAEGSATFDHLPEIVLIDCSGIWVGDRCNASPVLALGSTWADASGEAAHVAHEAYYWANISGNAYAKGAKISIVFSLKNVNGVGVIKAVPREDEFPIDARSGSCGPGKCLINVASIRRSEFDAIMGK